MKLLPKIDARFVVSSLVGALVVGGVVMAVRMLPNNQVTTPVKKVADIARG